VADVLVRLLAPVLVHTAEEAWQHLPAPAAGEARPESVHLAPWPEANEALADAELLEAWDWVLDVRAEAYALLEVFRQRERFARHSEARVALVVPDAKERARLAAFGVERLGELMLVAELVVASPEEAEGLAGERAEPPEGEGGRFAAAVLLEQAWAKCARCWNHRPGVGEGRPEDLCDRCRRVLAEAD
jgi:isoleucyl-tRNA synthetase